MTRHSTETCLFSVMSAHFDIYMKASMTQTASRISLRRVTFLTFRLSKVSNSDTEREVFG